MHRLVRYVERHHEPVGRGEFQCFATAGLGIALVIVLLCTMIRWTETRQAAQGFGSTYASASPRGDHTPRGDNAPHGAARAFARADALAA